MIVHFIPAAVEYDYDDLEEQVTFILRGLLIILAPLNEQIIVCMQSVEFVYSNGEVL